MKKGILIICIILISNSILSQNRDVEYDYFVGEITDIEINEILNFPIFDLTENQTSKELKQKLKSDLNTIASIMVHYKYAKTLKLTSDERTVLEKRMTDIADKFAARKKYVLFQLSGGYAPVSGIKGEKQSEKEVLTVMLGGDCITKEMEIEQERIYQMFNDQMKKNLAE